jgi:hypothetical protein
MGTTSEWIRVVAAGAIFGILMFLWEALTKRESFARWFNLAAIACVSLAWGMMMMFGWRVLHGGIAVVFAMTVLGLFATAFAERRARQAKLSSEDH